MAVPDPPLKLPEQCVGHGSLFLSHYSNVHAFLTHKKGFYGPRILLQDYNRVQWHVAQTPTPGPDPAETGVRIPPASTTVQFRLTLLTSPV